MVLREEKSILPLYQVKWVTVPHYDELSVKQYLPRFQEDEEFMKYMPMITAESRVPERSFFWNVANTVQFDFVQKAIQHANNHRMKAAEGDGELQQIEISEQWWAKLNAMPFVSCKYTSSTLILLNISKTIPYFMCRNKRKNPHPTQASFEASASDKKENEVFHIS